MEGFFPLKYAILSYEKCQNCEISGFLRGDIVYNETILNWKDPLKYFFLSANCIAGRLGAKIDDSLSKEQNRDLNQPKRLFAASINIPDANLILRQISGYEV